MNKVFYISACSPDHPAGGIYAYELQEDGAVQLKGFAPLPGSGYLCFSPDHNTLYATGFTSNGQEGCIAFAVNGDGTLTRRGEAPSGGRSCCHNSVSPDGKFLYAADYSSGDLAEFALDETGNILRRTLQVSHYGCGPNKKRQECTHVHFAQPTPDGKYIAVVDLGIDKIRCYPFRPGKGIDPGSAIDTELPPGTGPRHLAFAADGKIVYLLNELASSLFSLRYNGDGSFTVLETLELLPAHHETSKASAVRIAPDGKFLIATNRGFDTLVSVALDGKGGMKTAQLQLSGGSSPRDVNFLPGGKHFAGANEFSNSVYFYDYDAAAGRLTPNGVQLTMPRPLCVVF